MKLISILKSISDFIFKRFKWYRKIRKIYFIECLPISYGDHRNHVSICWKAIDLGKEDIKYVYMYMKGSLIKRYFILNLYFSDEKIDVIDNFGINDGKYKLTLRNFKINEIVNDK